MSIRHPGDQTLERYRNLSLNQEEAGRVGVHLKGCSCCRDRLAALAELDRRLSVLAMEDTPEDFTDRLMAALPVTDPSFRPDHSAGSSASGNRRHRFIRPELANAMVATAATYLFISSGIIGKVFYLDPGQVEGGFQAKLAVFLEWVDRLAQVIPS